MLHCELVEYVQSSGDLQTLGSDLLICYFSIDVLYMGVSAHQLLFQRFPMKILCGYVCGNEIIELFVSVVGGL